jgi:hypothetical protein
MSPEIRALSLRKRPSERRPKPASKMRGSCRNAPQRRRSTPGALAANRSSCSASTPTPILSAVLPMHPPQRSSGQQGRRARRPWRRPRALRPAFGCRAQQLRLATQALEPARGTIARRLDALRTLLAALADRDQLGLELPAALDSQAGPHRFRFCEPMNCLSVAGGASGGPHRGQRPSKTPRQDIVSREAL